MSPQAPRRRGGGGGRGVPVISVPAVPLPPGLFPEPDLACMTVDGDSMTGDGISDGDRIVMEMYAWPRDGGIAVVQFTLDGGRAAVLAHVRYDGQGGMTLESSNPAYPPRRLTAADRPAIAGRVVGLARLDAGTGRWEFTRIPGDPQ